MINPIIIHQPEKVVERTYTEGYRERIVERPTGDTEPLPAFVSPPMEQIQPPAIIVNVASPTSPTVEIIHEPTRSPNRNPQKERTPDRDTPASNKPRHTPVPPEPIASRPAPSDRERVRSPEQKEFAEPNKKSSDIPAETIPNNSGNNSPTELIEPDKPAPQASGDDFKKVGKVVGRQRRYDDLGDNDIEPIRELFLLRYVTGKHWPGLSNDMKAYYEKFYFSRPPKKGSKDYAKHVKCWERRTRWIAAHTA